MDCKSRTSYTRLCKFLSTSMKWLWEVCSKKHFVCITNTGACHCKVRQEHAKLLHLCRGKRHLRYLQSWPPYVEWCNTESLWKSTRRGSSILPAPPRQYVKLQSWARFAASHCFAYWCHQFAASMVRRDRHKTTTFAVSSDWLNDCFVCSVNSLLKSTHTTRCDGTGRSRFEKYTRH